MNLMATDDLSDAQKIAYYEDLMKLNDLHLDLAELYWGHSTDTVLIGRMWNEIERLERELGLSYY